MSLPRIIAQGLLVVVQVAGRAFGQAYREAAARAAKQGPAAAEETVKQAATAVKKAVGTMPVDEAQKILNVEASASWEDIMKNYQKLFDLNDKTKGGSFYLQSKVYRARETLEEEYKLQGKDTTWTPPTPPPAAGDGKQPPKAE